MSFTQTAIGAGVVFVALQTAVNVVLPEATPDAFMTVTRMEYAEGFVDYKRHVNWSTWAVWDAAILDKSDKAVCAGSGRSFYGTKEPENQPMPIDVFVGGDCAGRVLPGYVLQASWVPQDGSPAVVMRHVIGE